MKNKNKLEKFAISLSLHKIPIDTVEKAKLLILDSLSAIVKGNQSIEIINLIKSFTENKESEVYSKQGVLVGDLDGIDFRMAALINGIGMVADELDEGNPLAKGHPAAHFFPALLSISFEKKVTGKTFLEAFIVNYEISSRLGSVIKLKDSIHPHGNWGTFGNGFGIGKLLDWKNGKEYSNAAMLGVSFSMPTLWQSVLEGHKVRNVIIGLNNYHTTLLLDLVNAGFTASTSTLNLIYKEIYSEDYTDVSEELFDTYYLMKSYFKFYHYCRFCHSSVDVIIGLIAENELTKIKKIKISTYEAAAKLNARKVKNAFAGKFSIPYAIASELYEVYYPINTNNLERENFIQEIMSLIFVTESKIYTSQLPEKRITKVEIELTDNTKREKTVERATGDPDEYLLKNKVINKSKGILITKFEKDKVDKIIDTVLHMETLEDLSGLKTLLIK